MAAMQVRSLAPTEDPTRCLFFVYNGDLIPLDERSTLGIAAAVGRDGIAVTCAHVVLLRMCIPGARILLVHLGTRIAVEAVVLEEGWCGPDLQRLRATSPLSWPHPSNLTPKELDRDLAFLNLDFDSARRSIKGAGCTVARQELLDSLRVLPISAPGYKQGSRIELRAWRAHWTNRIPGQPDRDLDAWETSTVKPVFESADPFLGDVVQVESEALAPGFSGSPLWDEDRKVAVAIVRQGIKAVMPGRVLATDARALRRHSGIRLARDVKGQRLIRLLGDVIIGGQAARHAAVDSRTWIEPELRVLNFDPLTGSLRSLETEPFQPALAGVLNGLTQRRAVILLGDAGAGKSRLMVELGFRIQSDKLSAHEIGDAIPLLLSAQDLADSGNGLASRIEAACIRCGITDSAGGSLAEVACINGLKLWLLIDGMDELSRGSRVRLIDDVVRVLEFGTELPLECVIVSSRPMDEVYNTELLARCSVLEILPFRHSHIEAFVASEFPEARDHQVFVDALRRQRLLLEGGNPLQLNLATSVFRQTGTLPENPVALIDAFIAAELDRMFMESEAARSRADRREVITRPEFKLHARNLLALIGLATLHSPSAVRSDDIIAAIKATGLSNVPEWLTEESHAQLYVDRELSERSGLLSTRSRTIKWMHQAIAEHCAAEAVLAEGAVASNSEVVAWAFRQVWDTAKHGFVMSLLGLMEMRGLHSSVEAVVKDILRKSMAKPRAMLIPLRMMASGTRFSDSLERQIIQQFVRLLLADALRTTCAELLTFQPISDLADAERLCADERLKPIIIDAIEDRFRVRRYRPNSVLRRRSKLVQSGSVETVPISKHEDEILRRFGLRDEVKLQLTTTRPTSPVPFGQIDEGEPRQANANFGLDQGGIAQILSIAEDGSITAAKALGGADFAKSLVEYSRSVTPQTSSEETVRMFLRLLMSDTAEGWLTQMDVQHRASE